jgi:hypothetical protein
MTVEMRAGKPPAGEGKGSDPFQVTCHSISATRKVSGVNHFESSSGTKGGALAKQNYKAEKRRKDLEKQKKKAEKRQRKLEKKNSSDNESESSAEEEPVDDDRGPT